MRFRRAFFFVGAFVLAAGLFPLSSRIALCCPDCQGIPSSQGQWTNPADYSFLTPAEAKQAAVVLSNYLNQLSRGSASGADASGRPLSPDERELFLSRFPERLRKTMEISYSDYEKNKGANPGFWELRVIWLAPLLQVGQGQHAVETPSGPYSNSQSKVR